MSTTSISETDKARVREMARCLTTGHLTEAALVFKDIGAPTPLVSWSPDPCMTGHPQIERFATLCAPMSDPSGILLRDRFSLHAFGAMRDWLMILGRAGETVFRYEHYGRGIANTYGRDMTGATTDDFPGQIGQFFAAMYLAAIEREERVFSVRQPPGQVFVSSWRRLIVPMRPQMGAPIDSFVVLNLPENELRAGLEVVPLPTLILDKHAVVRFANKAARQSFDAGQFGPWNRLIFDYAGLDLELPDPPEVVLQSGITHSTTCRHVAHQRISVYDATITATRHHDAAFYVVMLVKCAG